MTDVLEMIASRIRALPDHRVLVAVDGVDGSGKSTFAVALAGRISWRPVVLLHADDFLNSAAVRLKRGRESPEAHWLDLYDYTAFRTQALDPLRRGGNGMYRVRSYDLATDRAATSPKLRATDNALVVVEGLFLHRDELVHYWDMSVFLDVDFDETARRMALRDGTHPDPSHVTMRRYVGGQQLYFERATPWTRATVVVDNTDVDHPRIKTR